MARVNRVFGRLKRAKLLRKHISRAEVLAGGLVLFALIVTGAWVAAQQDAFDPRERDIDYATLEANPVPDTLYKTPFIPWVEPGSRVAGSSPAIAPFPASLVSDGWAPAGRVALFTPDTLYEKINGQAEQYVKFGFVRLHVLTLENKQAGGIIDLFLYDQGSFANSLGLYEEQRGDKAVKSNGNVLYTPTAIGSYGVVGNLFFQVFSDGTGAAITQKAAECLKAMATLTTQAGPTPRALTLFRDRMNIPVANIGFTPVNVFQFSFAKDFWFASSKDDSRLFFHEAANPDDAAKLFARLHEEQKEEFDVVSEKKDAVLYRHQFLKTYFALRQEGTLVYGVEGYPDERRAAKAAEKLRTEIQKDG